MPDPPLAPLLTVAIAAAKPHEISARSICAGASLDQGDLSVLREIAAANPQLSLFADETSLRLGGPDEPSLDTAVDEAKRRCATPLAIGTPQVGYVEAISKHIENDYTYRKQVFGAGRFARLKLILRPDSHGCHFESLLVDGAIPERFMPAVAEAIVGVARAGPLAGFPVVATRVTLTDGAWHDRDSSPESFANAARAAFREALVEGGGLLEPIMRITITGPQDYEGAIVRDLISRRGRVEHRAPRGDTLVIEGTVPLAHLLGYGHAVRSLTRDRCGYATRFERYDPVPAPPPEPPPAVAMAMRK